MSNPNDVKKQIDGAIHYMVKEGMTNEFQFGIRRQAGRLTEIVFPNSERVSRALDGLHYVELYNIFLHERAYNVRMLDGALIQMMYEFERRNVLRHRLAFMPSPDLRPFQEDPDLYLNDELNGDVVAQGAVPFALRYDFDARAGRHRDVAHAKSHLTLGEYPHCRIPVSAPVNPGWFIDFVLRNFYQHPSWDYSKAVLAKRESFGESITPAEREIVHVVIPQ